MATSARHPVPPPALPNRQGVTVRKKALPVQVSFAGAPGTLDTLEGPVRYEAGAALLTAQAGDRWPVERHRFDETYEPLEGTEPGADGHYRKRPLQVLAWRLEMPTCVPVGHAGDCLIGKAGDWLVQYGPDDFGIVGAAIFEATYEVLGSVEATMPMIRDRSGRC